MKNGFCPKCNKETVYTQKGSLMTGELVMLKTALFFGRATSPDKYICVSCGYIEYYFASEDDLKFVEESWEKVPKKS